MKLVNLCGWVLVGLAGFTSLASGQAPEAIAPIWSHSSGSDTLFTNPGTITVTGTRVLVLDGSRQGIIELDGTSGKLLRIIGRTGDGPGEYRGIAQMAESPSRKFFAVHDQARRSVDFLESDGTPIRRISTGLLYFPKGLVVLDDSTIVLSGGRANDLDLAASVVWIMPSGVTENGPQPTSNIANPSIWQKQGRLLISGGPMIRNGHAVRMADAASGNIWDVTLSGMRKFAAGPGDGAMMAEQFMRRVPNVRGREGYSPWYSFPRAIFIEPMSGNRVLEAWSDRDRATLTFYELGPRRQPRSLKVLRVRAGSVARFDRSSFIVSGFEDDGNVSVQRLFVPGLN